MLDRDGIPDAVTGAVPARRVGAALREMLLPVVVYGAASAWFTWPLVSVGVDHLVTSSALLLNDLYLILWMLSWVGRALLGDPLHLFDGNALHPTPQVIAASEHLLGDMPLFLPVWLASDNAILALNVTTFASFVLSALTMHVLALRWTGSVAAAWVGGVAFAFAPWRADLGRPHLLQAQYLPLIAWGLDELSRGAGTRVALLTAAALALQVLCSYYLGYAAYVMVGVFVLTWLACGGWRDVAATWRPLAIALVAPLVVIVPASLPYVLARARGGLATEFTPELVQAWKAFAGPLLVLSSFAGIGAVVLGAVGFVASTVRARTDRTQVVRVAFLAATLILALLLAVGPAGIAGGWIAPYAWLVAIVPGFGSLRAPVRFGILASFAVSVLAAYAVAAAERTMGPRVARWPAALVGVAVVAGWCVLTPPVYSTQAVPLRAHISPAHRWLAAHGEGGPLLELPIDPVTNLSSARAMFVSTYHWLPLINGYTGYTPPGSAFLLTHAQQMPTPESLQMLVDCAGVRWILVHSATGVRREAWRRLAGVELVATFPPDRERNEKDELYRVTAPPRGGCPGLFSPDTTVAGGPVPVVDAPVGRLTVVLPAVLPPFRDRPAAVSLTNDGDVAWPATAVDPRRRFSLAYSWEPAAGGAATPWQRILLPADVAPGQQITIAPWITPPIAPGEYVLRFRAGQGPDPAAPLAWQQEIRIAESG